MRFGAKNGIAVMVGTHAVVAAEYRHGKRHSEPLWQKELLLSSEMGKMQAVREIADYVASRVGKRYVPVSIVLGSEMVRSKTLSLDNTLRKSDEVERYIRWRFEEEELLDASSKRCACQRFKGKSGEDILHAQLADNELAQEVESAFHSHGMTLSSMQSAHLHLHKEYSQQTDSDNVLVQFCMDGWSFSLSRAGGIPLFIKAKALNRSDDVVDESLYEQVITRIERYVCHARTVGVIGEEVIPTLHIFADEYHLIPLQNYLNSATAIDSAVLAADSPRTQKVDILQLAARSA